MDLEMVIRSNGDVTACCLDFNHALVYGNFLTSTFDDMFAPESFYWTLRREHETGTVPRHSICHNCDFLNNGSTEAQLYFEEAGQVKQDIVSSRPIEDVLQLNYRVGVANGTQRTRLDSGFSPSPPPSGLGYGGTSRRNDER